MDELFGELRAVLGRSGEVSTEGLLAVLRAARRQDPARYEDEWSSYLRGVELPRVVCGSLDEVEEWARLVPDRALVLRQRVHDPGGRGDALADVASDPRLANLTGLEIVQSTSGGQRFGIENILGSPHLTRLREVSLEPDGIRYTRLPMLAANTTLKALANSATIQGIERLSIHHFEGGVSGWRAFLGSPASHALEELALRGPFDGDHRLERPFALIAASAHVRLRHLGLEGVTPTAHTLASIFRSPVFSGLESFDLSGSSVSAWGVAPFSSGDTSMRPKRVRMGSVFVAGQMAKILSGAWLSEVESLTFPDVLGFLLDAPALEVLLGMPHMDGVRELDLGAVCALGREDLEVAARWPGLAGVRVLRLGGQTLDPQGLTALLASPHLLQLDLLDLEYAEVTAAAAQALVDGVDPEKISAIALGHVAWSKKRGRRIVLRSDLPDTVELTGIQ